LAIVTAALGSLACLVCLTIIAILMAGNTRANSKPDDEPKVRLKAEDKKEPRTK
jgi:hypothetical protein